MGSDGREYITMTIPVICFETTIFIVFCNERKHLSPCDLELNYVIQTTKQQEIIHITDDEEFVFEFCCENEKEITQTVYSGQYTYVISRKQVTFYEFSQYSHLPVVLSEIIYLYTDFDRFDISSYQFIYPDTDCDD